MEEKDIIKSKSGGFFGIIITEAVVTAVVLLSALSVKYFFKGTYASLKNWYSVNICAETDINEAIEPTGGGADEV